MEFIWHTIGLRGQPVKITSKIGNENDDSDPCVSYDEWEYMKNCIMYERWLPIGIPVAVTCHHHCYAWLIRWQSRWMLLVLLHPLRTFRVEKSITRYQSTVTQWVNYGKRPLLRLSKKSTKLYKEIRRSASLSAFLNRSSICQCHWFWKIIEVVEFGSPGSSSKLNCGADYRDPSNFPLLKR